MVVVGAGAAGMLCAAQAAARGRRVRLLDHRSPIGARIRISGGGRCNVTNRIVTAGHYLSRNPHFCRSALARFTPADILAMLDRRGIPWEEREHGQIFCAQSAGAVVSMLEAACADAGVALVAPCTVRSVERMPGLSAAAPRFRLGTTAGVMDCRALVVATGGLAVPRLGASAFGYDVARQFGLGIVEPRAGLVPLTLGDELGWTRGLAGVAFDTIATCPGAAGAPAFEGRALFTHHGLSGPAILQLSNYWQYAGGPAAGPIHLNLLPRRDAGRWLTDAGRGGRTLASALSDVLPRRFADALVQARQWPASLAECPKATFEAIAATLHAWQVQPPGTLGFAKAEVTLGGVETDALSSQTMEVRQLPGLHFIGEVVDVTGWLGGYNFQWAWASGWAAGQYA